MGVPSARTQAWRAAAWQEHSHISPCRTPRWDLLEEIVAGRVASACFSPTELGYRVETKRERRRRARRPRQFGGRKRGRSGQREWIGQGCDERLSCWKCSPATG